MLMPRLFTSVVLLLVSFNLSAQPFELSRKQLIGEWYSSNDDSIFFRSDTLVLLRRSDSNLVLDKMCVSPDLARECGLLNCMEFVNLRFRTRSRFEMWLHQDYSAEVWLLPMKWRLKDDVLSIEAEDLTWTYRILKLDSVKFYENAFWFNDKSPNPRLKLLRILPEVSPAHESDSLPELLPNSNILRMLDSDAN